MSALDKELVTTIGGNPAPQFFNPTTNRYEVITGRDGANAFIEKGRVVKDVFQGSETVTKTYPVDCFGFGIVNDGEADLTVSINEFEVTVKVNEAFDDLFEPFRTITITATDNYRAVVRV